MNHRGHHGPRDGVLLTLLQGRVHPWNRFLR